MIQWFKSLFQKGYYPKKCNNKNHYGKIITPTLSRRAISINGPCQCGFYKSISDFLNKEQKKLEEIYENANKKN